MKQWKNGDKFTAIDYTSERDSIKNIIIEKHEEAIIKARDLMVLSYRLPEDPYLNFIWMDPGGTAFTGNIDSNLEIQAESSIFAILEGSIQSNLTFTAFGGFAQAPATGQIASDMSLTGYVNVDFERSVSAEIESNLILLGVGQLDLSGSVHNFILSNLTLLGVGQLDLNGFVTSSFASNLTLLGIGQIDLEGNVTSSFASNLSITGVGQLDLNGFVTDSFASNLTLTGIGQLDLNGFATDSFASNLSITGVGQLDLSGFVTSSFASNLTLTGVSQFDLSGFVTSSISSGLTLSATGIRDGSGFVTNSFASNLTITGVGQVSLEGNLTDSFASNLTITGVGQIDLNGLVADSISSNLTLTGVGTIFLNGAVTDSISSNLSLTGVGTNFVDVYGSGVFYSATVDVRFGLDPTQQFVFSTSAPVLLRANVLDGQSVLINPPDSVAVGPGSQVVLDKIEQKIGSTIINQTTAGSLSASIDDAGDNTFVTTYRSPQAAWEITFTQPASEFFVIVSDSLSNSAVLAQVTADYPPGNYAPGTVAAVDIYDSFFAYNGTRYVRRVTD